MFHLFSKEELRRLIVPLVLEQILAVTIGMADTMMVAGVGEAAVSGISLVDTISVLLINVFSALATGGAVVAAQYLGRGEGHSARSAAKQLLYTITLLSVAIMTLSLFLRTWLLRVCFGQIEDLVMTYAQTYFWITALSFPGLGVYNAGAALFRSMGNSKISLYTSLLMNVINITGNALLINVFHLGVAGAAIATLTSRTVGGVLMLWLLRDERNAIYIRKLYQFEFHPGMVKRILQIGVPNGLENGMFQFGKILLQSLITSFGTTAIAANAVAGNVAALDVIPGTAIGLAMVTVVGRCVGAGDYESARRYTKLLMKITYLSMAALNLAIMVCAPAILQLYHLTEETYQTAYWLLMYHGICCIFIWAPSFALPNALRAANDARFTMLSSVIVMWLCRVVFSYLLANTFGLGVKGVWIAMTLDWLARAVAFTLRFRGVKWQQKQLI